MELIKLKESQTIALAQVLCRDLPKGTGLVHDLRLKHGLYDLHVPWQCLVLQCCNGDRVVPFLHKRLDMDVDRWYDRYIIDDAILFKDEHVALYAVEYVLILDLMD